MMKNTAKFRAERDREFQELFDEIYDLMERRKVRHARREAIRFTLANGKPRYHVSYDRASIVVPKILKNSKMPFQRPMPALMWAEIAQKVRQVMCGGKMSMAAAIEFVLTNCRASRFFITEHYAALRFKPSSRRERLLRAIGIHR
ncbi:MAG TPA: hypothetical protein DCQ56_07555 [Porphyromonadaceae bacterium]|nr:hypothetical protein [Porphyromonadaceae bacterium]